MGSVVGKKMSSSLLLGRPSKSDSNKRVEPAAQNVGSQETCQKHKIIALVKDHVAGLCAASVGTRYHAAENLAALGPAGAAAVPSLREVLRTDSSVIVRKSAAIALGEMGSAAQEALSDLRHAAHSDEDQFVRKLATQVIEELGFFTDCSSPKRSKLQRQSSL